MHFIIGLGRRSVHASAMAWLAQVQGFALSLFVPVILVDLLLPFLPLWGYLGRPVWHWSRVA